MDKLNSIISEVFKIKENELTEEFSMQNVENWDSLKQMDLITSIENGLDIEFTMDEILIMKDIKMIRKIVNDKLKK
jgi:acyl carrier protein